MLVDWMMQRLHRAQSNFKINGAAGEWRTDTFSASVYKYIDLAENRHTPRISKLKQHDAVKYLS